MRAVALPVFSWPGPFVASFPAPPDCPPRMANWLAATLNSGESCPPVASLTASTLLVELNALQALRTPTKELYLLADGTYDVYTDYNKQRQVGEVREGVFRGPSIVFLSNRGLSRDDATEPADYAERLQRIDPREQRSPGKPSAAVSDVRKPFQDNARCCHPGCTRSFWLRPRHHCRVCGRSACATHSVFRLALKHLYYPPDALQKVCDGCYSQTVVLAQMLRGDVYIGEWASKTMDGWGTLLAPVDSLTYQGDFRGGERTGRATITYRLPHRRVYQGEVVAGVPQGAGRMLYLDPQDPDCMPAAWDRHPPPPSPIACDWHDELRTASGPASAVFVGDWQAGQRHGQGVLFAVDWRYAGRWDANQMTGEQSLVVWSNGDHYSGGVWQGRCNGQGTLQSQVSGFVYTGGFSADRITGQGTMQYGDGTVYAGLLLDGLPQGPGRMNYAGGAVYTGDWAAGRREGEGMLTFPPASCCVELRLESLPRFPSPSPLPALPERANADAAALRSYAGQWADSVPQGHGKVFFRNGARYVGALVQGDCTDPAATTWYANGDVYQGEHKRGWREGRGRYTFRSTGNIVECRWTVGRRVGSEAAKCTHRDREEQYQGGTSYHPGAWFDPSGAAESTDAEQPTFDAPSLPDLAQLSREGAGVCWTPKSAEIQCIRSQWSDDLQQGPGQWALVDGAQLEAVWERRATATASSGTATGSHVVGSVSLQLPSHEVQLITAQLSSCLQVVDPSAAASSPYLFALYGDAPAAPSPLQAQLVQLVAKERQTAQPVARSDRAVMRSTRLGPCVALVAFGYARVRQGPMEWQGLLVAGRAEGWGRRCWNQDAGEGQAQRGEHVGQWHWGVLHGLGRSQHTDGSAYTGQYKRGVRSGRGHLTLPATAASPKLTYHGLFQGGRPHGVGTLTDDPAQHRSFVFSGDVDGGRVSGLGTATLESATLYEGQWLNGRPHGLGRLSSAAASYEGGFAGGRCSGSGRLCVEAPLDGGGCFELLYQGRLLDGAFDGPGSVCIRARPAAAAGAAALFVYRGAFQRSRFHGIGSARLYQYAEGGTQPPLLSSTTIDEAEAQMKPDSLVVSYTGGWNQGQQHGLGHLSQLEGPTSAPRVVSRVVGSFVHGCSSGYGQVTLQHAELTAADPQHQFVEYSGALEDGLRSGFGSSVLLHGHCHTGAYLQGRPHGLGSLRLAWGDGFVEGSWQHGQLHGEGKYVFAQPSADPPKKANGGTDEAQWAGAGLRALHDAQSVECRFDHGVHHGVCTVRLSASAASGRPQAVTLTLVLDHGRLAADRAVRVETPTGNYIGGVCFPAVGEASMDDPLRALLDAVVALTEAASSGTKVDAAAAAVAELLPSQPFAPTASNTALLLTLLELSGPFFLLHVLAVFLSHSAWRYHGQGRFVSGSSDYTGGWQGGDRHGRAQWSCEEELGWLKDGVAGAEPVVYNGLMERNQRHGIGALLLKRRLVRLTCVWHRGEPLLTHVHLIDLQRRSTYVGPVDQQLLPHGVGVQTFPGMRPYLRHTGAFEHGVAEGNGVRAGARGVYTGEFRKGQQSGIGRWEGRDGKQFVGVWAEDAAVNVEAAQPGPLPLPPAVARAAAPSVLAS